MMLVTSLVSLGTVTYLAYQSGKTAITNVTINQLTAIRAAKKQQVETYFRDLRTNFRAFIDVPETLTAIADLTRAFDTLGRASVLPERREKLTAFYQSEILKPLAGTRDEPYTLQELLPRWPEAIEAQTLFLAENPFPVGRKSELDRPPVDNAYVRAHAEHHPWLRQLSQRFGLDDLLLINTRGDVIYTVAKEADFGANVENGAVAGTALGQLVRQVMQTRQQGATHLIDYSFYWPSQNRPAAFVAAPVYKGGLFIGTIVAQLSINAVGDMMNDGGKWRERGFGASGSAYVVGPDLVMRSNFRNMIENPERFVESLKTQGLVSESTAKRMLSQNTTVLYYPIRNSPIGNAFQGRSNTEIFVNQRGVGALISYAPLDIPDLNWAVVARIDQDEVLAPQISFNRNIMIASCAIALIVTLAAMWLSGFFLRPVNALIDGVERIRAGQRKVEVSDRSNDEFGDLVVAFNDMSETINARDELIEGKTRAYEQLLRRIFPDAVADRMKQGEVGMMESMPQVTVIYVIIEGFTAMAQISDAERAGSILGEIVDRLDVAAEAEGVEKIKTVGDHYLAIAGLSVARLDSARRAVDFVRAASLEIEQINRRETLALGLRVGIATGDVQVGLVGSKRFVFDIWGYAASAARRIVHEADLNAVRLNETTFSQLADQEGIGEERVVPMTSIGPVTTYQLRLASLHNAHC